MGGGGNRGSGGVVGSVLVSVAGKNSHETTRRCLSLAKSIRLRGFELTPLVHFFFPTVTNLIRGLSSCNPPLSRLRHNGNLCLSR